jgi:uncharacterized protein (DUF486 family)
MTTLLKTSLLLMISNVFMTFAWYAHLRNLNGKKWYVAALLSWGIALFEYLVQVPANRIGYQEMNLSQLKILQEVITLSVFVPFAVIYMRQPIKLDYLWAAMCIRLLQRIQENCLHQAHKGISCRWYRLQGQTPFGGMGALRHALLARTTPALEDLLLS